MLNNKIKLLLLGALMHSTTFVALGHQAGAGRYEAILAELGDLDPLDPAYAVLEEELLALTDSTPDALPVAVDRNLIGAHVPVVVSKPLVINKDAKELLLKTKIQMVFKGLINAHTLGREGLIQVQSMECFYASKLKEYNKTGDELVAQKIEAEIIAFAETARLLKSKLQILTVRSSIVKLYFGDVELDLPAESRLNGILVSTLHAMYQSKQYKDVVGQFVQGIALMKASEGVALIYGLVGDVVADALLAVLQREKIIDLAGAYGCGTFDMRIDQHPVYPVITTVFDALFMNLADQYFGLEVKFKAAVISASTMTAEQQHNLREEADALMYAFLLQTQALSPAAEADLSAWANLFISKIIMLKSNFLEKIHVAKSMSTDKIVVEVYFKNSVLLADPLFEQAAEEPQLRGYVSDYESLVMRFLSGNIAPALDFYTEHYALLSRLRNFAITITPAGWLPKLPAWRSNPLRVHAAMIKAMIEVLEVIEKKIKNDDGLVTATQSLFTNLMLCNGTLPGETGNKAGKLGLTADQLKSILSGSSDIKDAMIRLAAYLSPLMLNAMMNWSNGGAVAVGKQDPVLVKQLEAANLPSLFAQAVAEQGAKQALIEGGE